MSAKRPNFFLHLHPPNFPKREGSFFYTFGLGGISLYLILVLTVTGILEVFYYIPSGADANRSLQIITYLIPYGNLIRGLHYWAGQLLVGTTILHLLRVVLTGSYKAPRKVNWLLGTVLLLVVLFFNFTGYGLRWDTDISWALLVGTNLLKNIPLVGDGLYQMVVGGSTITDQTIVRFYAWHIYGLTIIAIIFIFWHIFRVRRDGGISAKLKEKPYEKISRKQLNEVEIIAMFVVSIVLIILALAFPPALGGVADFDNIPGDATAPWFFIWVQQLLKSGDGLVMGIVVPVVLLALTAALPFIFDRSKKGVGEWFNREGRVAQIFTILMIVGLLVLTYLGAVE